MGIVLQLPFVLLFSSTIITAALGVMYAGALWYVLSSTIIDRRFCAGLYKATLHMERIFFIKNCLATGQAVRELTKKISEI